MKRNAKLSIKAVLKPLLINSGLYGMTEITLILLFLMTILIQNILTGQFDILACDEVAHACKANREPDVKKYFEQRQSLTDTNWLLSKPEEEGLDTEKLKEAIAAAASIKHFRSILVAKNSKLVTEEYYSRKEDPRPQHVQSITKSVTSLLIGIAIDQGLINSENETIKPYFPEYFCVSKSHDERKQNITIEELLTMTSRLNFADSPSYSEYKDTRHWSEPGSWEAYWACR